MTKTERCRKACACHATTLNCCQSVLCAFSDLLGMDEDACCTVGSGFGAGVRYGGICGVVSAAVIVLGILYPHTHLNGMEGKLRTTAQVTEYEKRFIERFGTLECRNLRDQTGVRGTDTCAALGTETACDTYIVSATELLCDMLEEIQQEEKR